MYYLFIVKIDKNLQYYIEDAPTKEIAEESVKSKIPHYTPNRANISFCFECSRMPNLV